MTNKKYLHELIKLYEERFSDNWIEKYSWSEKNLSKRNFQECENKINQFTDTCFVLFSKSILSGEFILNGVDNNIKNLLDKTTREYGAPIEEDLDDEIRNLKQEIYKKFENLGNNLKKSCLQYKFFINNYRTKVDPVEHNYEFQAYKNTQGESDDNTSDFIELVIPLCYLDIFFTYSEEETAKMFLMVENIRSRIKKENSKEIKHIFEILEEKCNFLLKKILFIKGKFEYILDFQSHSTSDNDIEIKYTKDFDNMFKMFNDEHPKENNIISNYQRQLFENKTNFSGIILLMRFYCKNERSSLEQINNLLKTFNDKYDNHINIQTNDFDKYALKTIKNVMYDCRLSYLIKQKDYDIELIEKEINTIKSIQQESGIFNYYPFKITIDFLISLSKTTPVNQGNSKDKFTKISEMLRSYINEYDYCIKKCDVKNFYPLQLIFEECCIFIKNYNFKLFIPSTFSQPVNYYELKNLVNIYKINYQLVYSKIEISKDKADIETIRDEVRQSTKKYIEIGGIFVAVLSFLFSIVNFTNNAHFNFKQVFIHSCGTGLIIMLFISSLYFLTLRNEYDCKNCFKSIRLWFFGLFTIISIVLLFLLICKIL